jgi:hypothetical protein
MVSLFSTFSTIRAAQIAQYFPLDNPINQTILSTFMRKKKIKYDIANNGAEAVAKFKTGGFHLILVRHLASSHLYQPILIFPV